MRFTTTAAVVIAALASTVCGFAAPRPQATETPTNPPVSGAANAITAPLGNVAIEAGKPFNIKWSNNFGEKVTLRLRKGDDSNDLDTVLTIVDDSDNDGEYTWTPPKDLEGAEDYAIEIVADGSSNYSPKFQIDSDGAGVTPSKTASASSSKPTPSSTRSSSDASESAEPTATESAAESSEPTSDASATSDETSAPSSTESSITAPEDNNSAAGQLSSPLALVLCVVAGLVYFH